MSLRRRKKIEPAPPAPEGAVCVEGYRLIPGGQLVERGERRPIDDWLVRRNPEYWRGLVPLQRVEGH